MEEQGTDTKIEEIEQAEEQAESIQSQEKPTVKYTEEDFQRAVSKGLANIQKQLDLQRTEAQKAASQLKVKEADLKTLQEDLAELENLKLDDPDFRETYTSQKTIREAQRKVDVKMAELEAMRDEINTQQWRTRMDKKGAELVKETGIDIDEFVGCQTEEEMEIKALRFLVSKKTEEPKKPEKTRFVNLGDGGGIIEKSEEERLKERYPSMYPKN